MLRRDRELLRWANTVYLVRRTMLICVKPQKKYIIIKESSGNKLYLSDKLMQKDLDMIRRMHGEIFSGQSNLRSCPTTEFLLKI